MGSKNISTLVNDIENLLENGVENIDDDLLKRFLNGLVDDVKNRLLKENRIRDAVLRFSNIGQPCERKLWFEINKSEESEPLRSEHHLKFIFGSIIEELMLFLAELAGHKVTGRQDESDIAGIKGHRDAIIDGTLVDVKSASSYSFKKFKEGKLEGDDAFGYIPQILSYLEASQNDEELKDKDRAAFLVVDKTLGHITLDFHDRKEDVDWTKFFEEKKEMVAGDIPPRGFEPEPMGKSGNMKLGTNCSYCPFKKTCFPEVRTFLYSYGPVHLTEVAREPDVPEIKEN